MTTEEVDRATRHLRDAVEHLQAARQVVRESDIQWCRSVVGQRITDGGRFLLDAERELYTLRERIEAEGGGPLPAEPLDAQGGVRWR